MSQPEDSQTEREFFLTRAFILFRLSVDWLRPTHTGAGFLLLSPRTQMLISCRNTLTDPPRNNVGPNIWTPRGTVKWTDTINPHT